MALNSQPERLLHKTQPTFDLPVVQLRHGLLSLLLELDGRSTDQRQHACAIAYGSFPDQVLKAIYVLSDSGTKVYPDEAHLDRALKDFHFLCEKYLRIWAADNQILGMLYPTTHSSCPARRFWHMYLAWRLGTSMHLPDGTCGILENYSDHGNRIGLWLNSSPHVVDPFEVLVDWIKVPSTCSHLCPCPNGVRPSTRRGLARACHEAWARACRQIRGVAYRRVDGFKV